MSKQGKVILTHPVLGDREFDPVHAENLLGMDQNGGWTAKGQKEADQTFQDGSNDRANSEEDKGKTAGRKATSKKGDKPRG